MGIRTIIIIAALYGLYWIIRNILNSKANIETKKAHEDMVECKVCGVHLPVSKALEYNENNFCCEQHKDIEHPKNEKQGN